VKDPCMTTNAYGEKVTAHCHYWDICFAYPGTDGWPMIAGRRLSKPLLFWLRHGRRPTPITDPDTEPRPPCPVCGSPVRVYWYDVEPEYWLPLNTTCTKDPLHETRGALSEARWPKELTEEDRVWLRQHLALTAALEAS
jgi:hypothetical protein